MKCACCTRRWSGRPRAGPKFAFVGDIGRLPNTFQEFVQPGGLPGYTTATVRSVGMGWRGPYVNTGTSANDYLTDGFGRAYTGAATGQVRSAVPMGLHAVRVVKTNNPGAGNIVAQDTVVVRPGSTTAAELWF